MLEKSKREGISIDDLATELLSEGVVLRAWEIIERKMTMNKSEEIGRWYYGVKEHKNYFDIIVVDSTDPIGPGEGLLQLIFIVV